MTRNTTHRTPIYPNNTSPTVIGPPMLATQSNWNIGGTEDTVVFATAQKYVPPAPTVNVLQVTANSVSISISSNGIVPGYFAGYEFWFGEVNADWSNLGLGVPLIMTGAYTWSSFQPGRTYYVGVVATTTGSASTAQSNIVSVVTPAAKPVTIPVPNVVNMLILNAEAVIQAAGFSLGTINGPALIPTSQTMITQQQPAGGSLAAPGSAVNLVFAPATTSSSVSAANVNITNDEAFSVVCYYQIVGTATWYEIDTLTGARRRLSRRRPVKLIYSLRCPPMDRKAAMAVIRLQEIRTVLCPSAELQAAGGSTFNGRSD